jgi:hypothetical protein
MDSYYFCTLCTLRLLLFLLLLLFSVSFVIGHCDVKLAHQEMKIEFSFFLFFVTIVQSFHNNVPETNHVARI